MLWHLSLPSIISMISSCIVKSVYDLSSFKLNYSGANTPTPKMQIAYMESTALASP